MNINDFLSIAVVGVGLSLSIDSLKAKLGTSSLGTKALTLALAVLVGAIYVGLRSTPYFETILTVLGTSSVVYSFFLKN